MAISLRRPLTQRLPQQSHSPVAKRLRSPGPEEDHNSTSLKRVRTNFTADEVTLNDKPARQAVRERKLVEKEQQKAEFRDKYRRAFPSWTFYFDLDHIEPDRAVVASFETRIHELGGTIEDFFSNQITHLVTNQSIQDANKENVSRSRGSGIRAGHSLKSPIKLKGRTTEDSLAGSGFDLMSKALSFGMKIWTTSKLDSVLNRCLDTPDISATTRNSLTNQPSTSSQRALSRLLQSERIHGISERDPMQKRHDFQYFSKASYFVLVEDLRQELATIIAHEYEVPKARDKRTAWPVLYCHPCARGPFVLFDDREKKRWERQQQGEKDREAERDEKRNQVLRAQALRRAVEICATKKCDLRRSISHGNLQRRASYPLGPQKAYLDVDILESNHASGYLASGASAPYVAASGNSVGITSATGTTSTASYPLRIPQLPPTLNIRMKQTVLTSRRICGGPERNQSGTGDSIMGPPEQPPQKILRKSRSTNTLRLPRRDESSKPGYCESCRIKFDDFNAHILNRKHQKFAADDANYSQLDCVLARVQRQTLQQAEYEQRSERHRYLCSPEP